MKALRFDQVDVFGDADVPLSGNPLAVVHGAAGWSDQRMADFARWTNLSETTFLLPPTDPQADYRVRIFMPSGELGFAGHPTLGSAWAWLHAGGAPRAPGQLVQQCGIGCVPVRHDGERLAFAAPPRRRSGPLGDEVLVARLARVLGVPRDAVVAHQHCDNGGPRWLALLLADGALVRTLAPRFGPEDQQLDVGVVGPGGGRADFEVRAFFAGPRGMSEDPVTGSLNAALAQWLIGSGQAPARYVAAQGSGRLHIEGEGDTVWVGGSVVGVVEGHVA